MTTTSWTTTADVPLSAWSAMVADMRTLLAVTAASGAAVTGVNGNANPTLTDLTIAFTVTAPASQPLTVQFQRTAGDGEVVTNAPHTDGLVLAALSRARAHWGALLTVTSDAGVTARGCADHLADRLYGDGDRAIAAGASLGVPSQATQIVGRAQAAVAATDPHGDLDLGGRLDALIAALQAERAGISTAEQLLTAHARAQEATP